MLNRILTALGYEKRATDYNPAYAPDAWRTPFLNAGGYVTPASLLSNVAVASRCVSLRANLLASQPLKLYRRLENGDRERVTDHPLADVLGDLANPLMTGFELREFLVRSLDLYGNAYSRIERDGRGQVIALHPMQATVVQVEQLESGRLRYRYTQTGSRGPVVLLQDDVLHIRNSSEDGLLGRSPIAIARGAMGLAVDESQAASVVADSHLTPHGAIAAPARINQDTREDMRAYVSNPGSSRRLMILEHDMKWLPTSFSAEDAQLLESRKLSNHDTCHIFDVPPAVLGLTESVAYASATEAGRALVQNCLQPLAERVEQAMARCLLSREGRRTFFIEHDLRGLVRGNLKDRFAAYRIGREIGMYSVNELRRAENEPAVEGGDTRLQPATLAGSSIDRGEDTP